MTFAELIAGIDHPVVAVRDMEDARARYQRLGFTVAPRGSHVEWGTGNWVIMFEHDYLELRGVIDPERYTHNLGPFLAKREGLMGVALGAPNVDACRTALVNRGFELDPVSELTRNFELPEGWVRPQFALCFVEPGDAYGLMWVLLCQHLTPELMRQPAWLQHANGAVGVASLVGAAPDLERAWAAQRRLFGDHAVVRDGDEVRVRFGERDAFRLATGERLRSLYPYAERLAMDDEPALAVIQVRVPELSTVEDLLALHGVEHGRTAADSVCVPPGEACGAIIDFVATPVDFGSY
jgi:catechol 2,3-dioxygenase-like lactoylglutathione lyase family enzyme